MNQIFKSILFLGAAGGAVFYGLRLKQDREIDGLKLTEAAARQELTDSAKQLEVLRAKVAVAKAASTAGGEFEEKHNASLAVIAEDRKKIAQVQAKWTELDAGRAEAVRTVRQKETTRPPAAVTLADGSKLTNFVVRSVPDETMISAEHSSGLVKIPVAKLPADMKTRLGFGWKEEPPAVLDFDAQGNAVVKQGGPPAGDLPPGEELDLTKLDTGSLAAVVKSLALVETHLSRAMTALSNERGTLRKLGLFKQHLTAPDSGKTYAALTEECNGRLAILSSRVQALQSAQGNLRQKLKAS